jgi:hypothetical protein
MDFSPLHVWAVVRLLPNMQRIVINRFRRRSDAENYLHLLRRYTPGENLIIVFDPPSKEQNHESQGSKLCEPRLLLNCD